MSETVEIHVHHCPNLSGIFSFKCFKRKQHANDLQTNQAKTSGAISISPLNIQPVETYTGTPLAS